jgi:hypothetical protein
MFYLLQVYALAAALVLVPAGVIMLGLYAWSEASAYAAAHLRIQKRRTSLANSAYEFANSFVNSRSSSRLPVPRRSLHTKFNELGMANALPTAGYDPHQSSIRSI